jgi:hypothetical protein
MRKSILTMVLLIGTIFLGFGQTWQQKTYVDDFGDPTDEKYSTVITEGKFSNSATTNSELLVKSVMSNSEKGLSMTIYLYEYGSNKANFSSAFGSLKIKDQAGNVHSVKAYQGKDGYLYFTEEEAIQLITLLESNKVLKCRYDEVSKYGNSSYSFVLSGEKLAEAKQFLL